jgi:hypothetical protein
MEKMQHGRHPHMEKSIDDEPPQEAKIRSKKSHRGAEIAKKENENRIMQ